MGYDYRDSHTSEHKPEKYDRAFQENPLKAVLWSLEKRFLKSILRRFFRGRRIEHLDFACGTGRILAFLEARVSVSVGVDLSSGMLDRARSKVRGADLFEADLTRDDVLGDRRFDLITAFRFFPNAQPELRSEVMRLLVHHLRPGGHIVFNNHKNDGSMRNRLLRVLGRRIPRGMTHGEVDELVGNAGLRTDVVYHAGLLVVPERLHLPRRPHIAIERVVSAIGPLQRLCQDLVYVCSRAG